MNANDAIRRPNPVANIALLVLSSAALLWACWPALAEMAERWARDPRYSHGFLVPVFALYIVWTRRKGAESWWGQPSWWGLIPLLAGAVVLLAGGRYYVEWLAGISLVPLLLGAVLLVGGWPLARRSWPAVLFLGFMVPLPYQVEMAVGQPLQRVATLSSNYILQTLGLNSVAEGNVIVLDHGRVGVVEACNGLGMIFMFGAFTAGAVLLLNRPAVDKVLILLSTVPIALAANVLRVTVTAVLHETIGGRVADAVYHDFAGWLMMPIAVGTLWLELAFLSRLFVERPVRTREPLLVAQ